MLSKKLLSSKNFFLFFTVFLSISSYYCIANAQFVQNNIKMLLKNYEFKIGQSKQILIVQKRKIFFSSKYLIYGLEKKHSCWKTTFGPMDAVIGKNGFAPIDKKREGDGKTPSGIFSLKQVFGYNKFIKTKMPYRQLSNNDVWVDDPDSSDYNQLVKKNNTKATSFEKMKRADNLYKYGIVIGYNTEPTIKGHGSAIFLHIWKGKNFPTAGCVAVSEKNLVKIIAWLDPKANPIIIMGLLGEDKK